MLSRRELMAGLGTMGISSIAGCPFGPSESEIYLDIVNNTDQSQTIHIAIKQNEEGIYDSKYILEKEGKEYYKRSMKIGSNSIKIGKNYSIELRTNKLGKEIFDFEIECGKENGGDHIGVRIYDDYMDIGKGSCGLDNPNRIEYRSIADITTDSIDR